jgi:hypothetical protein
MTDETARLGGGRNIAMKVPSHQWDDTVRFYREVVGLEEVESLRPSVVFALGANRLWIDRCGHLSQAEIWLELVTEDVHRAAERLAGVARRDDIEPLPDGFPGFWIQSPASIVHLVAERRV